MHNGLTPIEELCVLSIKKKLSYDCQKNKNKNKNKKREECLKEISE